MKLKKLLKFYFFAEELNSSLDKLALTLAVRSYKGERDGEYYFKQVARIAEVKSALSSLWARLDGVISALTQRDRDTLKAYASMRVGVKSLSEGERKELHRATVKLRRRGGCVLKPDPTLCAVLSAYYVYLSPPS